MSLDRSKLPIGRPHVERVDIIIKARKEFIGKPESRRPNRHSEQVRFDWPLLVNGQTDYCYVSAILYPNEPELRFNISLIYLEYNIWRLDFDLWGRIKVNPPLPGHEYNLATIDGPHCHPWDENRRFAVGGLIPEPLPFRVPLDKDIQTWENAFRYFAGATNIGSPVEVPIWPPRERLL